MNLLTPLSVTYVFVLVAALINALCLHPVHLLVKKHVFVYVTVIAEPLKWSHEAVMLLLSLKQGNVNLFTSNTTTQKQAWNKISRDMSKHGYSFSGDECDKKFRALKNRQVPMNILQYIANLYCIVIQKLHTIIFLEGNVQHGDEFLCSFGYFSVIIFHGKYIAICTVIQLSCLSNEFFYIEIHSLINQMACSNKLNNGCVSAL
jgi:hypothetical protein